MTASVHFISVGQVHSSEIKYILQQQTINSAICYEFVSWMANWCYLEIFILSIKIFNLIRSSELFSIPKKNLKTSHKYVLMLQIIQGVVFLF